MTYCVMKIHARKQIGLKSYTESREASPFSSDPSAPVLSMCAPRPGGGNRRPPRQSARPSRGGGLEAVVVGRWSTKVGRGGEGARFACNDGDMGRSRGYFFSRCGEEDVDAAESWKPDYNRGCSSLEFLKDSAARRKRRTNYERRPCISRPPPSLPLCAPPRPAVFLARTHAEGREGFDGGVEQEVGAWRRESEMR